jgi:hypothetical protein
MNIEWMCLFDAAWTVLLVLLVVIGVSMALALIGWGLKELLARIGMDEDLAGASVAAGFALLAIAVCVAAEYSRICP